MGGAGGVGFRPRLILGLGFGLGLGLYLLFFLFREFGRFLFREGEFGEGASARARAAPNPL